MRIAYLTILLFFIIGISNSFSQEKSIPVSSSDFESEEDVVIPKMQDSVLVGVYEDAVVDLFHITEDIEAEKLWLFSDKIVYMKNSYSLPDTIGIYDVRSVEIHDGNYALRGMAFGAISSLAFMMTNEYIAPIYDNLSTETILIIMGGSSIIGLLGGLAMDKMELVYYEGDFTISLNSTQNYSPKKYHYSSSNLIGININF